MSDRTRICGVCGAEFQRRFTGGVHLYCGANCRRKASYRKALQTPPPINTRRNYESMRVLREEAGPGVCICCDRPLPIPEVPSRTRVMCKDPECYRTYQQLYAIARLEHARKLRTLEETHAP